MSRMAEISQFIAEEIGRFLTQEYRLIDGKWWLITLDKPARQLTDDEVKWHTDRRHFPFVPDGMKQGDLNWWKDPVEAK